MVVGQTDSQLDETQIGRWEVMSGEEWEGKLKESDVGLGGSVLLSFPSLEVQSSGFFLQKFFFYSLALLLSCVLF